MGDAAESGVNDPRWLFAVGKLKLGLSVQQAQSGTNLTAQRLAQAFPDAYKEVGVKVEPLQKGLFGWSAEVLYLLFAAVGFVLLIACTNVANLLLVRGDGRRREIGVRVALGASRSSVIRQLLTESVLLSLVGGVAGLIFSFWGVRILNALSRRLLPTAGVSLDARVLFFTFLICVLTGLVFGLIPAYRASKNDPNECLRDGGRSTATKSRHRTRNILVVAEIAVALVSLICAGLMISTLARILHTNPGFNPDYLLTAEVRLTGTKYMDSTEQDKSGLYVIQPPVGIFCRQVLERVKNIPGVESAALIDWLPLSEYAQPASPGFTIVGRSAVAPAEKPDVLLGAVSPDYFGLMGIPIVRGRGVTEQDTETFAEVVVINEAMARRFWPNEDPVGREITPVHTVPGWTESCVHKGLVIRTQSMSAGLIENARRVMSHLAPDSPVFGVRTVEQTVSSAARPWRVLATVRNLCRDGVDSRRDRDLRSHFVFRGRAQPRAWPANGTGSAEEECAASGFGASHDAVDSRSYDWGGRLVCRCALAGRIPLWGETPRCADYVTGFIPPDRCDVFRQLYSGSPRYCDRSHADASARLSFGGQHSHPSENGK
jgi:hypothetical protein